MENKVDLDTIRAFLDDSEPKRINFASHHANALQRKEGDGTIGILRLPFDSTFEEIAKSCLSLDRVLFPSRFANNYYRQIRTEEEFNRIESFIEEYRDLVFLRDTLDLSIALSMHESDPNVRTEFGEHEFRLKYRSEQEDTREDFNALLNEFQRRLESLPFFKEADYICAIPSSKDFLRNIIAGLKGFSFADISDYVSWENKCCGLKNLKSKEEKLEMVQAWGLRICEGIDLKGKTVLLVDDLYQSGVTMQYVAMCLKNAGAKHVFGIALVKSLGN